MYNYWNISKGGISKAYLSHIFGSGNKLSAKGFWIYKFTIQITIPLPDNHCKNGHSNTGILLILYLNVSGIPVLGIRVPAVFNNQAPYWLPETVTFWPKNAHRIENQIQLKIGLSIGHFNGILFLYPKHDFLIANILQFEIR